MDIVNRMRPLKTTDEIVITLRDIRQCISSVIIYAKDKNTSERFNRVESPPSREWNHQLKIQEGELDESALRNLYRIQPTQENIKACVD
jgi:hypothetical protein